MLIRLEKPRIPLENLLEHLGEPLTDWTIDGSPLISATIEGSAVTLKSAACTHVIETREGSNPLEFLGSNLQVFKEISKIEVWDGHVNWSPPDPFNSFSCLNDQPEDELRHTLVNAVRMAKNDAILAAEQEERRLQSERVRAEFNARRAAHQEAFNRKQVAPFAEALIGKTIKSMTLVDGHLVVETDGSPPLTISIRSVGIRSFGGILNSPTLVLTCGDKELSGHSSTYLEP